MVTFGGAYTAVPFLREAAVVVGGWMTSAQFVDGLAIGNVLPSPLVIISTFVGFMGRRWAGAVVCEVFEWLLRIELLSHFLDGVTVAVVGLIGIVALQLLAGACDARWWCRSPLLPHALSMLGCSHCRTPITLTLTAISRLFSRDEALFASLLSILTPLSSCPAS
jgi:chromate transport protein ChrA